MTNKQNGFYKIQHNTLTSILKDVEKEHKGASLTFLNKLASKAREWGVEYYENLIR